MTAFIQHLTRLRRPLIASALALLVGGGLALWSQAERSHASTALQQHTARLTQAQAMLQSTREADTAARNGLRQIAALHDAGLLDAPDRQAWHQHLLGLQGKLGLAGLEWELGPLKPASPEDTNAPGSPPSALRLATLHLKGEIAHEGRLLALLERPATAKHGLFLPRSCRLERSQPTPDAADTPALAVDCEIDWLFLQLPAAP